MGVDALTEGVQGILSEFPPEDLAYLSLVGWAGYCDESWVAYPHVAYIAQRLQAFGEAVARGERRKLMIFVPSQHGKSSIASRYFTSWMLGRFPHLRIIFASYAAGLAELWSRRARDTLRDYGRAVFGVSVRGDSQAADHWELEKPHRGVFHAVGVGGGASGHSCEVAVLDDPVKDREEAESETIRKRNVEWYKSVLMQRRPKGIVLLMTRWQVHDLAGWLLEKEAGQWEVISFPAIAEENDVLGRKPGDALCPAISDAATLENERRTVGPYVWASMYRQIPLPPGEGLFKRSGERFYRFDLTGLGLLDSEIVVPDDPRKIMPLDLDRFITVDTATSEDDSSDHTSISAWGYDKLWERLFLLDEDLRRIEAPAIMEAIVAMCRRWKTIAYIEENSTSKHLLSFMEAEKIPFRTLTPGGKSKFTRAIPASARWARGGVWLNEGAEYLGVVQKQVYNFTGAEGGEDDFVDTLSMAERVILEEVGVSSSGPGIASVPLRGKPSPKGPPGYAPMRRPPGM